MRLHRSFVGFFLLNLLLLDDVDLTLRNLGNLSLICSFGLVGKIEHPLDTTSQVSSTSSSWSLSAATLYRSLRFYF
jgi:hypothetical protein